MNIKASIIISLLLISPIIGYSQDPFKTNSLDDLSATCLSNLISDYSNSNNWSISSSSNKCFSISETTKTNLITSITSYSNSKGVTNISSNDIKKVFMLVNMASLIIKEMKKD